MVIHWNISIYLHKGILYKIHFLTKKVLKNIIEHFIYISFSLIYEPTLWVSVLHKFFLSVSQSFQSLSCVQLFATPWTAACQASLYITSSRSLFKLMSIESLMSSNHLILSSPSPPAFYPSQHQSLCQWVHFLHQIAKVLEFCFSISPSNEYSGLISFRIDWFNLLAVQGTCKSLLQHHSLKASILWCSAFFIVQLSHPYMTSGRIISLTINLCWQSDISAF